MNGFVVQTSAFGPTQENGRFGKMPTLVELMHRTEKRR